MKRAANVWGIDIGASGVRAVCLEMVEIDPRWWIVFIEEFETPLCRPSVRVSEDEIIGPVIERFLESHDVSESKVWMNVPASHLVSRFVRLPPLSNKEVKAHIKREIEQRIPIPMEDLVAVRWGVDLDQENGSWSPRGGCGGKTESDQRSIGDVSVVRVGSRGDAGRCPGVVEPTGL